MSPLPTFELLRFEATPVASAVAVVEVDGRFTGLEPTRPRLLVEGEDGVSREFPALAAGGTPWSATFAVPLFGLEGASFSLVPGRGPLIALPDVAIAGDPGEDRFVRLARTANELRRRLGEATESAAAAAERLAEVEAARESLEAEVATAREEAARSHEAAVAAREAQAGAEGEADAAREELARARDEARAAVEEELARAAADVEAARTELASVQETLGAQLAEAQERAIAAEDDAYTARGELHDARARVEALERENRSARIAAARTHVPSATPDSDDAEFRAARIGAEWADEEAPAPEDAAADAADTVAFPGDAPGEGQPAPDGGEEDAQGERFDAPAPAAEGDLAPDATAPTTAQLDPVDSSAGLWSDDTDDSVRFLRPRTPAGRRRPAPIVLDEDDEDADDATLDLAPAETHPRARALEILASPRVIVGGIFFLLLVALALIFAGVGPV